MVNDVQAQRPDRPGGPGRRGGEGRSGEGEFDAPPVAKNDFEKKILATLEEMGQGARFANVSPTDGRLLRMLTESINAKTVVEIGTSTGESGVWFAMALARPADISSRTRSTQGRAKIAQENFKKAGVDDLITIILGDAHETVKQHKDPIDVLFLDADKEGYHRLSRETAATGPAGRPDHRPQHERADGGPELRQGHHHQPGAGDTHPAAGGSRVSA